MLKLKNVSKYYHSNEVVALGLRKVSLDFELGEFVAVTGESGSGKSTLLNVISGLDTYEDGEMFVNNEETSYFSIADWETYRRQYIGFVFQNYNIIDSYSVLENVMIALKIQGYDKEKRKERAIELITKVGLETHLHHKASKLSGGQKQRAVIARALAKDCPIIVCDEPTGNLDSESSATVMGLLQDISHDKLVIVVTHNFDEVEQYATRKIRLFDGEVVEDKLLKAHEIVEEKQEIQSYVMNTLNLISIAFRNLFRTPKRTIFTGMVFLFITAIFTLIYGFFVNVTSDAGGSSYNYIFNNVTENRIIVTKFDETAFTPQEVLDLISINRVVGLNKHDVINDSSIYNYILYEDEYGSWIDTRPAYINPSYILDKFDLKKGSLPTKIDEVVIEDSLGFDIGDKVYLGFSGNLWFDENDESLTTASDYIKDNSIEFTVVGLVPTEDSWAWYSDAYFYEDFLEETVVITQSYLGDGNRQAPYQLILGYDDMPFQELSYMNYVIDDTLADNEIEISDSFAESFQWTIQNVLDVDVEADPDFYLDYTFYIESNSTFSNTKFDIQIVGQRGTDLEKNYWNDTIYLNQATFNSLITDEAFQLTVYAKDVFDAKIIKADIEEQGFNAIYPRNIEDPFSALSRIILSVVFGGLMFLLMVIVYFIVFLVLRNIQESKKKDFLILRSIGASKTSLNKITVIELFIATVFGIIIVFSLLFINSKTGTVKFLVDLLGYYSWGNYVFLFILLALLSVLLGRRFNGRIFNKSVITSLKSE